MIPNESFWRVPMAAALLLVLPGCVWLTEKPWWLTDNYWWRPGWPPRKDHPHRVQCAPPLPPWTINLDDPPPMEARKRRAPVEETRQLRAAEPPPPTDNVVPPLGQVPTAAKVGNRPGLVETPFPPYRQLDVSGMASGSLARDPVSGKLFRVP